MTTDTAADPVATPVRSATEPPEARGLPRDGVRLLVARPGGLVHAQFRDLPEYLEPGDLVVVNVSATLPAAVDGSRAGEPVVIHVAAGGPGGRWTVELRRPDATGPVRNGRPGEVVELPGGARLRLERPADGSTAAAGPRRLWRATVTGADAHLDYLRRHGRPISYAHTHGQWPLEAYQTVFAREPGSAEMPSAGRPFSERTVVDLVAAGIAVAPVVLHTGVSSQEAGEPPQPEWFAVPAATARAVNDTRRAGSRVVAVGTTVTRALESAADRHGRVRARSGWTDLVIGPDRPAVVVGGLVTGWHEPGSSHLDLLRAVARHDLVDEAYAEAGRAAYRWHEFGDSCLLLPNG